MKEFIPGLTTLANQLHNIPLEITGSLPSWLQGTLIRNGPAKFEAGLEHMNHWFDGFAMLHRFHIQNDQIHYTNQFLQSEAFLEACKNQKICFKEFATNPKWNLFTRLKQMFVPEVTDNTNVNVTLINDEHIALIESCHYLRFDPQTLSTISHFNYEDGLGGDITTAHPHYDFKRKELYNFIIQFGKKSHYCIFKVKPNSQTREPIARIPIKHSAYMHSFAMSDNYIILIEPPLRVNPLTLLTSNKTYFESYHWQPEQGTCFTVIDKHSGKIITQLETDTFFMFHQINAYEKNKQIIIDLPLFANSDIIPGLYLKNIANKPLPAAKPVRFILDLINNHIQQETLSDCYIELPRINYRHNNTHAYQFTYACSNREQGDFLNQLVKIDVTDGNHQAWHESCCYPGEPVFVANPDANGEDDGVILSVVLNAQKAKSFLLLLDASSFTELARIYVPHPIPFGFHGQFYKQ